MEILKAAGLIESNWEDFISYFQENEEILFKKDKSKPLILQVYKNISVENFFKLLDMGFLYDFVVPSNKMSFLQTLILNEEYEKAIKLVVKYPIKNINFVHEESRQTALMMASYMNEAKLGQALLFKGADPTLRDKNGLTALQIVRLNNKKH